MPTQTLREFIEEGLQKQGVVSTTVRTDSIYVFEETGEIDLIWWLREGTQLGPELSRSKEPVEFRGYSLTTQVETAIAPTGPLDIPSGNQLELTKEDLSGDTEPALDGFSDIIDEVIIGIDELAEIIMEYDEEGWVNIVGLSAHSTEIGQALDAAFDTSEEGFSIEEYADAMGGSEGDEFLPQLEIHVDWNLPKHQHVGKLTSETRFDHIRGIEIETGLRVPVEFTTTVATRGVDEKLPGQPIHTGGSAVEFTELEPVNIRDEIERIDFQELLYDDRVYPDKPESWPLEDPLSIVPESHREYFQE